MEEELNRKTAMQLRHQQLHGPLTELVACFLQQSKYPTLARSLDEFIEFSETQTLEPGCRHSHYDSDLQGNDEMGVVAIVMPLSERMWLRWHV
jgi:hypothetical protein